MSKNSKAFVCLAGLAPAMFLSLTRSMPQSISPSIKSPIIAFTCSQAISLYEWRLGGICTIRADGSDFHRLTNTQETSKPVTDKNPVWSPDGNRIAFLSNRNRDDNDFDIYVINADGSNIRRITHTPRSSSKHIGTIPPHWSTDSKRLAYIEGTTAGKPVNFWVVNADGSDQRKLDLGTLPNSVFEWVSPDTIAFISERDSKWALFSVNQNGSNIRPVMSYGRWITSAIWSPDRKRIAFSAGDSGIILYDNLYVSEADGSNVLQLTNERGQKKNERSVGAQKFAWSPDGKQIAFTVTVNLRMNSADIVNICVANTDGTGQRVISTHGHQFSAPAWSPDGKYIAFHSLGEGRPGIYLVNRDGSNERFLVEGDNQTWRP
ncbi:MAG TPA: hypothetical protein VIG25_11365 [Pyrinomonadaceae bacterium]